MTIERLRPLFSRFSVKALLLLIYSLAATSGLVGVAHAQTNMAELATESARLHETVIAPLHGQLSGKAVYVGEIAGCSRVGILSGSSVDDSKARIVNFAICDGRAVELTEVSPALPDDTSLQATTFSAIQAAIFYGSRISFWQNYRVASTRLSTANPSGCAIVETTISQEGLLVSSIAGRICLQ